MSAVAFSLATRSLGAFRMLVDVDAKGAVPPVLFTENETNTERLFQFNNASPYVKDAFHEYVIHGRH